VNILGLDLSLTATGIAIVRTGDGDNHRYRTEVINDPPRPANGPNANRSGG
jgi:hypothetical protein